MLFKKRGDAWARPSTEYDVIAALPDSVVETPLGLAEERVPVVGTTGSALGATSTAGEGQKIPPSCQAGAATRHAGVVGP